MPTSADASESLVCGALIRNAQIFAGEDTKNDFVVRMRRETVKGAEKWSDRVTHDAYLN